VASALSYRFSAVFLASLLQKCGNLTTSRPRTFNASHDSPLQLTCQHTRSHSLDLKSWHFLRITDHTMQFCTALAVHPELQLPPKCRVLASGAHLRSNKCDVAAFGWCWLAAHRRPARTASPGPNFALMRRAREQMTSGLLYRSDCKQQPPAHTSRVLGLRPHSSTNQSPRLRAINEQPQWMSASAATQDGHPWKPLVNTMTNVMRPMSIYGLKQLSVLMIVYGLV
jgi:hypothetical protein